MPPPPEPEPIAPTRTLVFQAVLLVGGLLALTALTVGLGVVHAPLVLGAVGGVLLWPLRAHRPVRALLAAGGLVLLWWFAVTLGGVLAPFLVVYILAWLFNPAVEAAARRWRVPRWVSSLVLTLLAVGALVGVLVFLVPNVLGRIEALATGLLESVADVEAFILESRLVGYLEENGFTTRAELERQLGEALPEVGAVVEQIPLALQAVFNSVSTILALVTVLTLIPVLLYYTLRDYPTIERAIIELFPTVGGRRAYLGRAAGIVGSYLRGQIIISAIAAFNIGLFLTVLGVPFSLLIGLLAGLFNMIPNVGAVLTNVVGVLIALVFGTTVDAVAVLGVVGAQQLLEGAVLAPNIMSHQVGLHPILIILSLLVFGAAMGLVGLLIAVPVTALAVTFYQSYREAMTLELTELAAPAEPEPRALSEPAPVDVTPT